MGIFALVALGERWYGGRWENRIMPRVHVGVVDVGGKTQEEARLMLEQTIDTIMRAGLPFVYQSKRATLAPIISASDDPDLTYELVRWNVDVALLQAFRIGHEGPWWQRWYEQTNAFLSGVTLPADNTIDRERLRDALAQNFATMEEPARNAELVVTNGSVTVTPESLGKVFDYDIAIAALADSLASLSVQPISLAFMRDYPTVTKENIEALRPTIERLLSRGVIQLTHDTRWWRIHPEQWGTWLTVANEKGAPRLLLTQKKIVAALTLIGEEINVPARDAKFVMKNGRVVEFQTAKKGKRLSTEKTINAITKGLLEGDTTSLALVVEEEKPSVPDRAVNTFDIVELIGVGTSNFKGSPTNRRHNIAVGARSLNGLLVTPGEEFSLLKALGEIDGEHGYKPELVIKGNRTIPEFGGGLCQIGTTTFRAALGSGLPITERQNHSYSVPYYLENGKPGVDATIYGPKPDFKFVNDTGNTILIQTRIKGDDLTFEFWGKKDGRVATRSEPIVTSIRRPPPTKIIETEDLKPGKKKCTERAHTGSTAQFTYTVTMPDGEKREKVFRSVYRPWQEVCLVGKEKVAEPMEKANNTNTTPTLPSADAAGVKGE